MLKIKIALAICAVIVALALIPSWFKAFSPSEKSETNEYKHQSQVIITPSVVGINMQQAIVILRSNKLRVGRINRIKNAGVSAGLVVDQNPKQDTRVAPGTYIDIFVQTATKSSQHLLVDQIMDTLDWGNIAFNHPPSMQIQEVNVIELLVSLGRSVDDLTKEIIQKEIQMATSQIQGGTIRVSNRMEARLTGSGFQITALTPEMQALGSKESTAWKWEIKAISEGLQTLHLTIAVILSINGKDTPKAIRTFNKKIYVNVSLSREISMFFKYNWQWLWAAILLPFAGWAWKRWRNSAGKKKPPQ